jgi:hypothetical protein
MSIGVSVRTIKFAARNNSIGVRQTNDQREFSGAKATRNPQLHIVCREAKHRQIQVLHAVIEMVETSCKVDPSVSSYRRGHQTT